MQFHCFQRHNKNLLQQRNLPYPFHDSQSKFQRKTVILSIFLGKKIYIYIYFGQFKSHIFCTQFPHDSSVANNHFVEEGFSQIFSFVLLLLYDQEEVTIPDLLTIS